MFQVPAAKNKDWKKLFDNHRAMMSSCDVYFENMIMLNGRHTILDRETFNAEFRTFTNDIDLVTSPIDAFEPAMNEGPAEQSEENETDQPVRKNKLFVPNRETPEYKRIKNRITMDQLHRTFNETHPVMMALSKNEVTLETVVDDIYIYYCFFKFARQIELVRINSFSNYTPIIEYVVTNVTYDDLRRFLVTKKIDEAKVAKHTDLCFFAMDRKAVTDFYLNGKANDAPEFDLDDLIDRLISNIVYKNDIYMILAVYLVASFAVSDFKAGQAVVDGSPCAKYVIEVLSAL